MPLLHAGAGDLTETATQAWQRHSVAEARFGELGRALQRAPPAQPTTILRFLLAELARVDRDPAHGAAAADVASVEALTALPAAPLSLSRAVALCMNAQGYVPAAAQVALLQTYGGVAVDSAAQTLAEDMQRDAACPRSKRSRRGCRARRTRDDPRPRPGATDIASDDEHHSVPVCPDSAAAAGADTWRALDDVDLAAEMRRPVPTLQDVPPFVRAAVRDALVQALRRLRRALTEPGSAEGVDAARAWKLFLLAPRVLLTRTDQHGSQGRAELLGRASAFQRGDWLQLLQAARRACRPAQDAPPTDPAAIAERKRHQACFKVKQGELSRARQVLTTCDLAPGTEATWAALTDPARRPPEPRTTIGQDVLHHQPDQPPHLTTRAVAAALRSARRGCAPGLSGMRAEHLKLLLQDSEALELLAEACTLLAQARVPTEVCKALAMARPHRPTQTRRGCTWYRDG